MIFYLEKICAYTKKNSRLKVCSFFVDSFRKKPVKFVMPQNENDHRLLIIIAIDVILWFLLDHAKFLDICTSIGSYHKWIKRRILCNHGESSRISHIGPSILHRQMCIVLRSTLKLFFFLLQISIWVSVARILKLQIQ